MAEAVSGDLFKGVKKILLGTHKMAVELANAEPEYHVLDHTIFDVVHIFGCDLLKYDILFCKS